MTLHIRRSSLLALLAFALACMGQYYRLYLPAYTWDAGIFFAAGGVLFIVALLAPATPLPQPPDAPPLPEEDKPRWWLAMIACSLAVLAWQQSSRNTFTLLGVVAWWGAILVMIAAFWTWSPPRWRLPIYKFNQGIAVHIRWATLAVIGLIVLAAFFRFYRLDAVPTEMNSDHVEKLYDINDLLHGAHPIYFERNTGREPMQFYFTFALIKLFNTGLSFYSLKLSNALMGILSVVGTYLVGREIGGKKIGLLAGFFAAVSFWPVATSRIGLRYPFAPAFTSLALWSLLRAMRTRRRNDWLIAGLILGVGLHGYTAFRAMPLAALALVGLYLIVRWQEMLPAWPRWLLALAGYGVVAALVFLPLAHYWMEKPDMFWYRSFTRMADVERPLDGNPVQIMAGTISSTLGMFNWRGDEVWVTSIPTAPVIDTISGGLFLLGLIYVILYLGRKNPLVAAQLIVGAFILLLPSGLSLAFPRESPSVVRAGGAMPLIAVMIALPLQHIVGEAQAALGTRVGRVVAPLLLASILVAMAAVNFQRYFVTYFNNYRASAQNTREVSDIVREYAASVGDTNHVYLKGWPYWLDARAISLQAAKPGWELTHVALDTQQLLAFPRDGAPRLYILHPLDIESLQVLQQAFPDGWSRVYHPRVSGVDVVLFFVPGHADATVSR